MNNSKKNKNRSKNQAKKKQGRKKVINYPIQTSINYGEITKRKLQAISAKMYGASDSAVFRRGVDILFDKEFGENANIETALENAQG